ncbi:MAG: hypothetical protein Q7R76_01705 [Candidatus Woesearchaeota archaeon]|nr:hypothetical protein [Candidatus Woesearchaeota archaeon]
MDNAKILATALVFFLLSALLTTVVAAEENVSAPEPPAEEPIPEPVAPPAPIAEPATPPAAEPTPPPTPEEPEEIIDFELVNVTPDDAQTGDVLLKIMIKNSGNTKLENLVPVVVARGFSTYDTIPLKSLTPFRVGELFVSGHIADAGDILLTIKINDKIFYDTIKVIEKESVSAQERLATEVAREKEIGNFTAQVAALKTNYDALEQEVREKKKGYDLSDIKLDDLKKYLLAADAAAVNRDLEKLKTNVIQARGEYVDQKERLAAAQKKSFMSVIRDNIIFISAIAGGIVTIFAGYELLKKKQQGIVEKIKEIKTKTAARRENKKAGKEKKQKKAKPKKKAQKKEKKEAKNEKSDTEAIDAPSSSDSS